MRIRKTLLILILCLTVFSQGTFGTHNRAGEITYKQLSDLTFEITIWTYTFTLSAADRD